MEEQLSEEGKEPIMKINLYANTNVTIHCTEQ